MSDETNIAVADDPAELASGGDAMSDARPEELPMLPGEVHPHPSPFQYVMIAVVLCVITGLEVGMYYLTDSIPRGLYVAILLTMALTKFVTVVSWYMHLRSDRLIFRRLFIVGGCGALVLYTIVLSTLHVFE